MLKETFTCRDCHEVKPITHECGTGYASLRDGHRICYACCAERDKRFMVRKGVNTLYLTNHGGAGWEVTNWPGSLRFRAYHVSTSRHACWGWNVKRIDAHFNGPDGFVWHAVVRGDMDLARCKRTKVRA